MPSSAIVQGRLPRMGRWAAVLVFLSLWLAPSSLPMLEQRMAAIFAAVVVAWLTEALPLPVTALLIAPAMVAAGITDAATAFHPYADPVLFLFVGGLFLAQAMSRHGLDQRLAQRLITLSWAKGRERRTWMVLVVTAGAISAWVSNTTVTAMLLPIAMGCLKSFHEQRPPSAAACSAWPLGIAYASTVGGLGTLVGTPPNLITARFLDTPEHPFGFSQWLIIGVPMAIGVMLALLAMFWRSLPSATVTSQAVTSQAATPLPEAAPHLPAAWSRGEKVTASCFLLAIVGWLLPSLLELAKVPGAEALADALPGGSVALLAAAPLFLFKAADGQPTLPWREANRIDWGTILLFGGGITLGQQILHTGLAARMAHGIVGFTHVSNLWSLTALTIVFAMLFSEICSNTATATIVVPLVIAIAKDLHVSPVPPALAAGIMASCAYMMPVGTASNALAYSSGYAPLPVMIRRGLVLDVLSAVVVFTLLRLLCPLYGWS